MINNRQRCTILNYRRYLQSQYFPTHSGWLSIPIKIFARISVHLSCSDFQSEDILWAKYENFTFTSWHVRIKVSSSRLLSSRCWYFVFKGDIMCDIIVRSSCRSCKALIKIHLIFINPFSHLNWFNLVTSHGSCHNFRFKTVMLCQYIMSFLIS